MAEKNDIDARLQDKVFTFFAQHLAATAIDITAQIMSVEFSN